ncbi:Hypothetical predicted protein [Cloeon dipterum]|uniref:Gamma-secretase-activating protein C-terminal domain-containing protein n=2 Tax=Cloeon dipterum TaxID=197152 RepID=A0A8S1C343_9INSE|nr:Hypothetical predicted protein [Cloeon dipterum]
MSSQESLEEKFNKLLFDTNKCSNAANWKVLGQEQDGFVLSWESKDGMLKDSHTRVGFVDLEYKNLKILHNFGEKRCLVQATVNKNKSLIGYTVKTGNDLYEIFLTSVHERKENRISSSPTQAAIQFLHRTKDPVFTTDDIKLKEKFLVFMHQQNITLNQVELSKTANDKWFQSSSISSDIIVRQFSWAQWDPHLQSLFYVSVKATPSRLMQGEEDEFERVPRPPQPSLSCLQFHDDLPHETVLNIPLNLPEGTAPPVGLPGPENQYCENPVPLKIHDNTLELSIICNSKGLAYVCHHYIYYGKEGDVEIDEDDCVNFAYSVTALHHCCVIECVISDVPANLAYNVLPTFVLHGEQHLLVFASDLFTHLLDVGSAHEPCNHVIISPPLTLPLYPSPLNNAPVKLGALMLDLSSLEMFTVKVTKSQLSMSFRFDHSCQNRIAILHQLLQHYHDYETVSDLMKWLVKSESRNLTTAKLIQELLVGTAYANATRNIPNDALPLISILPLTTASKQPRAGVVWLQQKELWNTAMTLLSPQQRLVPYRADTWTRLWDAAHSKPSERFSPSHVADKLMLSLLCYQPEALSRSSTPLSPGAGICSISSALPDLVRSSREGGKENFNSQLPFQESETCTASKQEYVVAVNLRELSMHLLKGATQGPRPIFCPSPMHVHAVATRFVGAQLEASRQVCRLLAACAGVEVQKHGDKGFLLIDQLDENRRKALFIMMERFLYCAEALAFPVPQGFTSFFAYLGYRTLPWPHFLQYTRRHVFELHVDAIKAIFGDMTEKRLGVSYKVGLLQLLPRTRARRILNQWGHPISYMYRAREHALLLLSGESANRDHRQVTQRRNISSRGIAAFPSADRLSPLDTFLDLLTAKASLTELDIPLLVEATITSTEDFLI